MFTDLEKTLTRDEIRKCILYGNPENEVECEEEKEAHWEVRNAYVEYIEAWNCYNSFENQHNKDLVYEKKEKVKKMVEKYKEVLKDGGILLAMKAAYIDANSR